MHTPNAGQLQPLLPLLGQMLGHRPSPATAWRWINQGVKVGEVRVCLEAKKIGGKLYSTTEAVEAFINAQNAQEDDNQPTQPERTPETVQRLTRAGLL